VLPVTEATATTRDKVVIIGSCRNRIGQGIEFDYSCVQAVFALKAMNIETIMINCNPETVSTDYDTADRLYFEPITVEDVLAVIANEQSSGRLLGVIVQLGGQTPLKLTAGCRRQAFRFWAPCPMPLMWPKTVTASASCWTA
jgi:carbamoyl-phosphate synthase large subunit